MKEKERERLIQLKEKEKELEQKGVTNICGIDEAGRGPLAGPVVVAGVIMPPDSMIEGINDSKKVSEKKREQLYELIIQEAVSYAVAVIQPDIIDEINEQKAISADLEKRMKDVMSAFVTQFEKTQTKG